MICTCCKEDKSLDLFVKDKYKKSGYKSLCKKCSSDKMKEYHAKNKEKERERLYKWREENVQYWSDYMKFKRGTNPDFEYRGRAEKYTVEEARARDKERKAQYDIDNKEKNTAYRRSCQEHINEMARARNKDRRKVDPSFRLTENLRCRLKDVTRDQSAKRLVEYDELFGCTIEFFRKWIEGHWLTGMSWENYGNKKDQWCLDHHYPCAAFDMTDPNHQKQCFHYSNTYPMWSIENFSKNNDIPSSPRENLYIPDFVKNQTKTV